MELTKKQLDKLHDKGRMADHWHYWAHEVLSKSKISKPDYKILLKLTELNPMQQINLFLVDGKLTELPKNRKNYRLKRVAKKHGEFQWHIVDVIKFNVINPLDDK